MTPAEIYVAARCRGLAPPRERLVSEWAAAKRILPLTSAMPGKWQNEFTPYLREIMDALSTEDPAETVVFMKAAQTGGTEAGLNWLGFVIENAPGLMLYVMPT